MTTDETQIEPTLAEAPVRKRPRWRRWWAIALYVLVVLVVGIRVALPYVLQRVIESQGEAFLAGKVKVANVDLWLLRGAVAIEGVELSFVPGDMRAIPYVACFDAAINMFTAFGYFSDEAENLAVLAGAAPNLTNLMTRTAFAGWTFDLITDECRDRLWHESADAFGEAYLAGIWMYTPADATRPLCFNEAALRQWLRNAPGMKPMYTDPTKLDSTGGLTRGMPNLNLNEEQIDLIVAYLLERK